MYVREEGGCLSHQRINVSTYDMLVLRKYKSTLFVFEMSAQA